MPGGRPTKYTDAMCATLRELSDSDALGAATINEIADVLSVSPFTVYHWIENHSQFSEAVAYARKSADRKVESALFKRSLGYTIEDNRKTVTDGPRGTETKEHTQYTHIPPDTAAASFWLKNRDRANWSDKTEVTITGDFAEKVEALIRSGKV